MRHLSSSIISELTKVELNSESSSRLAVLFFVVEFNFESSSRLAGLFFVVRERQTREATENNNQVREMKTSVVKLRRVISSAHHPLLNCTHLLFLWDSTWCSSSWLSLLLCLLRGFHLVQLEKSFVWLRLCTLEETTPAA